MSTSTIQNGDRDHEFGGAGHRRETGSERTIRRPVTISAITALGGLLFGDDTGVIPGALLSLKS
jgi:hypothetical protein